LEDIDDDELAGAYDKSSYSGSQPSKLSDNAGNGNPNRLPGIPGARQIVVAAMLDRSHSVGSASVGKVQQVNYIEMQPQNQGSGSLILDEDDK
jgi:hypothetical protein